MCFDGADFEDGDEVGEGNDGDDVGDDHDHDMRLSVL